MLLLLYSGFIAPFYRTKNICSSYSKGPFGGRSSDYKFPIFKPGGKDREWWKVIGYRLLGIITTGKRVAFFGLRVSGKVQTSSEIQGFKIVWDVDAERA